MVNTSEVFLVEDDKKQRRRDKLSDDAVLLIFAERPMRNEDDQTFVTSTKCIQELADYYGIQPRTVRDIWNRRSWGKVTRPAWSIQEIASDPNERALLDETLLQAITPARCRKRGRPHGAKDTNKRHRRKSDKTVTTPSDTTECSTDDCPDVPTEQPRLTLNPVYKTVLETEYGPVDLDNFWYPKI
eukprot:CAMPEP_0181301304 /NCGR_PEP_ID=MMETSP1101-20121128/7349_1 /TAXON_ID=46948 /ORGANISM="Rhodomonas abbreviata, Strain Caron Lab Isolate" /LENGTH=185 /DNA_ID=CAMNT_0023406593 /DNA_START=44 /DNA_END=601 /DNA_ORIENTATION=+